MAEDIVKWLLQHFHTCGLWDGWKTKLFWCAHGAVVSIGVYNEVILKLHKMVAIGDSVAQMPIFLNTVLSQLITWYQAARHLFAPL